MTWEVTCLSQIPEPADDKSKKDDEDIVVPPPKRTNRTQFEWEPVGQTGIQIKKARLTGQMIWAIYIKQANETKQTQLVMVKDSQMSAKLMMSAEVAELNASVIADVLFTMCRKGELDKPGLYAARDRMLQERREAFRDQIAAEEGA